MKMTNFVRALLCVVLALGQPLWAYEDRIALVIGNDAYPTEPLRNAVNDARAVAKALTDLGFKVVVKTNADINTMRSAAVEFAKLLEGANAAVFYYAGHGIQYRDKNYLVPIDAKLTSEPEIVYHALEVSQLLDSMDDAKVRHKFVILDACRNNPFRNVFMSTGLAKIAKVPPGTIISYAAAAGAVAADGGSEGEHGLYTKHFLKELQESRVTATEMFSRVQTAVATESRNAQLPELYSTPLPRAAFVFADRGARAPQAATQVANQSVSGDAQASLDKEFWSSIKDGKNAADFQAYLEQFPNGTFARLARNRLETLRAGAAPTAPAAVASAAPASTPVRETRVAKVEPAAAKVEPAVAKVEPTVAKVETAAAEKRLEVAALPSAANESRGRDLKSAPAVAVPTPTPAITPAATQPVAIPVPLPVQPAPQPAPITAPTPAPAPAPTPTVPLPVLPKTLIGPISYPDGARYNGEYKVSADRREIREGKGEFIARDFRYVGSFSNDKREGEGTYTWANGDSYTGTFRNDEAHGSGTWVFARGDKYEGEIVRGKIIGKGVFTAMNGDRIEGTFKDSLADGNAVYRFANGDRYDGPMVAGKINGKGIYNSKSGDRTEAHFVDGNAEGKGVYYYASGDRYEGEFKRGALTGRGTYFFSNGLRAEGDYVNGSLKGKGAFYFNDGSWFEGDFEDGLKRATGTIISKDGTKRPATMVDGKVIINP